MLDRAQSARTWRRWLQFRLRTLLLFVTASALLLAVYEAELRRFARDRQAAQAVACWGGSVTTYAPGPAWRRWLIGERWRFRITQINLEHSTKVNPAELAQLRGLSELRVVRLPGSALTPESMPFLEQSPNLSTLLIRGSVPRDVPLARLAHLNRLYLLDPSADGEALRRVGPIPRLSHLHFGHSGISSDGLQWLSGFTGLTGLHFNLTRVTDRGLEHLASLKQLNDLTLFGKGVTDAGLCHLEGLTELRSISAADTSLTRAGIQRLQTKLPRLSAALPATPEEEAAGGQPYVFVVPAEPLRGR